ncbi:hypothetical protein CH063_14292, partial [Colletotrichum higginsianum]
LTSINQHNTTRSLTLVHHHGRVPPRPRPRRPGRRRSRRRCGCPQVRRPLRANPPVAQGPRRRRLGRPSQQLPDPQRRRARPQE